VLEKESKRRAAALKERAAAEKVPGALSGSPRGREWRADWRDPPREKMLRHRSRKEAGKRGGC